MGVKTPPLIWQGARLLSMTSTADIHTPTGGHATKCTDPIPKLAEEKLTLLPQEWQQLFVTITKDSQEGSCDSSLAAVLPVRGAAFLTFGEICRE